jgi:hypothetical protein
MTGETAGQSVEVTYSAADIAILNFVIWRFWVAIIAIMAAILIAIPVILSLIGGDPIGESIAAIDWRFTGWMILFLICWLIVVTVITYGIRRLRGLHGPIRLSLNSDGVAFRNREMDGVVFWSAIKGVKLSRSRIFLFISRRSALIVPRRVFASDDQFCAFSTAAKEHWRERHHQ